MREIRTLRAMWRGLETESRTTLHGHEGGNPGYRQGESYGLPRQSSTLPRSIYRPNSHRDSVRINRASHILEIPLVCCPQQLPST